MSRTATYDSSTPRRAFYRGVALAFAVALLPVAIVATGLFFSGHTPQDFSNELRDVLIWLWLVGVFAADRIGHLAHNLRKVVTNPDNSGVIAMVLAASAMLATIRIYPSVAQAAPVAEWFKGFVLFLLVFATVIAVVAAVVSLHRRLRLQGEDEL